MVLVIFKPNYSPVACLKLGAHFCSQGRLTTEEVSNYMDLCHIPMPLTESKTPPSHFKKTTITKSPKLAFSLQSL